MEKGSDKMKFDEKLLYLKRNLESEFENDCIKVSYMFDPMTRFLSIGVDHPLWPNFLIQGAMLADKNYDDDLKEIYDIIKHDLVAINKFIGETYE
jgi:hypothetical protein